MRPTTGLVLNNQSRIRTLRRTGLRSQHGLQLLGQRFFLFHSFWRLGWGPWGCRVSGGGGTLRASGGDPGQPIQPTEAWTSAGPSFSFQRQTCSGVRTTNWPCRLGFFSGGQEKGLLLFRSSSARRALPPAGASVGAASHWKLAMKIPEGEVRPLCPIKWDLAQQVFGLFVTARWRNCSARVEQEAGERPRACKGHYPYAAWATPAMQATNKNTGGSE